jgi:GT2 family glycosyltransferase
MARASMASLARLPRTITTGEPRVTVALVSWNRPDRVAAAVRSVRESARVPHRILIVDNASSESTRERLRAEVDGNARAELVLLGSNTSCARNRALAVERSTTEYVLFLDDDAEIFPGTLEILLHALDSDPGALAAAANVVLPDGTTQICGGDFSVRDGVVLFTPMGAGQPFDAPGVDGSGPCRWASGACVLHRRAAFERFPLDPGMDSYFEDSEWGFRVERAVPGALLRCPEALALHHHVPKDRRGTASSDLAHATRFAESIAHFYRTHGLVMDALFGFVPELRSGNGYDVPAAHLFLELLGSKGAQWTVSEWHRGGLAPLFRRPEPPPAPQVVLVDTGREALRKIHASRWWKLANAYWAARRRLRAAVGLGESP